MLDRFITHYRITGKLGEGGMGVVYRAHDQELDRDVAIKVLPEDMAQDVDRLSRFAHEAQALANLTHPNILQVYELGRHENRPFMVTELLAGQTLRQRMEGGSLGWRQAAEVGAAIADGLAAAHQAGIVHRDLKPSNVFLTADGRVKVIDFGLARTVGVPGTADSDSPTLTNCTATGSVLGTVGYMAPEQVRGKPADGRSDIFSLGCMLYEMVSGNRAFCRETAVETMSAILKEEPAELSSPDDDLPPELASIIRRCLSKGPEARFQSASDLAYNLRSISSSSMMGPPPEQPGDKARRMLPLYPAIGAAAVILVVIVIIGLITRDSPDSTRITERSLAVVNFLDLANPEDPTGSAGLMGLLHVGLMDPSPIRVLSPEHLYDLRRRKFGSRRGLIDNEQALEVAREAGASDLLNGQMGGVGQNQYVIWRLVDARNGEIRGAGRVTGTALTGLADQVVAEVLQILTAGEKGATPAEVTSVATLTTTSPEAYKHYIAGKLAAEEIRGEDAYRHFLRAVAIDSTFALAHFALSQSWYLLYETSLRRDHMKQALKHRDKLGTCDRLLLEAWDICFNEHRQGDYYAEAKKVYKKVLARWPDDRDALFEYAYFLFASWDPEDALLIYRQGLTLFPHDQLFRLHYGLVLNSLGRFPEYLASTRIYFEMNPGIPNTQDEMGLSHLAMGFPDSAEYYFEKALEIDPDFFYSRQGLGYAAYQRGEPDRAIEIFKQLLENTTLSVSQRRSTIWRMFDYIGLGLVYFDLGRFSDYFELVRRETDRGTPYLYENSAFWYMDRFDLVLQSADSTLAALGPDPENLRDPFWELHLRGMALCELDSLDEAQATYDRMLAIRPDSSPQLDVYFNFLESFLEMGRGNGEAALVTLAEVRKYGSNGWSYLDILIRSSEAEALRVAGRHDEAVVALKELLRLYGGHMPAYYHLGKIYEEMDRPEDAEQEYEIFLEAWSEADEGLPKLVDARKRLAELRSR